MSDVTRRRFLGSAGMATAGLVASPAVLRLMALGADSPILVGSLHDQSGALGTSGHAVQQVSEWQRRHPASSVQA